MMADNGMPKNYFDYDEARGVCHDAADAATMKSARRHSRARAMVPRMLIRLVRVAIDDGRPRF